VSDQSETKAALEAAIQAELAGFDTGHGVLTDWIVIAAQQNFDDDGEPTTSVGVLLPTDSFPMYRILGLLDHATVRYRTELANWSLENE
jgi:hypothetical protein